MPPVKLTSDISKMTRVIEVSTKEDNKQYELNLRNKNMPSVLNDKTERNRRIKKIGEDLKEAFMAPVRPEGPYPPLTPEDFKRELRDSEELKEFKVYQKSLRDALAENAEKRKDTRLEIEALEILNAANKASAAAENLVKTITRLRKERNYKVLTYFVRFIVILALISYGILIWEGVNAGEMIHVILERILIVP